MLRAVVGVAGVSLLVLTSCGGESDRESVGEPAPLETTTTEAKPTPTDSPATPATAAEAPASTVPELTPEQVAYIEAEVERQRQEAELTAYAEAVHQAELEEQREVEAYLHAIHEEEQREADELGNYLGAVHREEMRQEQERAGRDLLRISALSNISTLGCYVTEYDADTGFWAYCNVTFVPPGWTGDEWLDIVLDKFIEEEEARQRARWNSGPSYEGGGDLDCEDVGYEFEIDPDDDPHGLDGDGDGIACEGW